jgi:RimJ/RimL family protein N-acetyltransferase
MGRQMKARILNPGDIDSVRALRLAGIGESPAISWASHAEESAQSHEQMCQRLLATDHQVIFGGFIDERLVAMAGFKRETMLQLQHRGNIWGVYVAPEIRNGGAARQLLEALLGHAREIVELLQVTLVVGSNNDIAKALYSKLGFVKTGVDRRAVCIDGNYCDEDRMVMFLDSNSVSLG